VTLNENNISFSQGEVGISDHEQCVAFLTTSDVWTTLPCETLISGYPYGILCQRLTGNVDVCLQTIFVKK